MASTITGGIKFLDKNRALLKDGGSASVTSGDVVSDFMIDSNPITYWNSVGSTDLTTENLIFSFNSRSISRILLVDHNFKQFTIQYWNGSAYVNFSSVYAMTGAVQSSISETVNTNTTNYYEFTPVTTALIKVAVLKTQSANDEKYLNQFIATTELGTLSGYPDVDKMTLSNNFIENKMLSGKSNIVTGYSAFSCLLNFARYPASLSSDLDLIFTLFDRQDPFLLWLCGGRSGSTYFKYQTRGFRTRDVFQCKVNKDLPVGYYKNLYTSSLEMKLSIIEHV